MSEWKESKGVWTNGAQGGVVQAGDRWIWSRLVPGKVYEQGSATTLEEAKREAEKVSRDQ
jgi:hypothetical protein